MTVSVCDQLEPDGSLLPVDRSTAVAPSIKRTWFLSLVTGLVGKVTRRDGSAIENASSADGEDSDDGSDAPGSGASTPRRGATRNGRAAATTMAGGKRRKAVSKKKAKAAEKAEVQGQEE